MRVTDRVNVKADAAVIKNGVPILLYRCPRCEEEKQIEGFGLRRMGNGTTRRQSHCTRCRGQP